MFADAGRAWKQNGRDPSYTRDNKDFGHNIGTTAGVGLRLNTSNLDHWDLTLVGQ